MFEIGSHFRSIETNNLEELSHFQPNKNRHYTQLKTGNLNVRYNEVNLGSAQIMREALTTGGMIQATPNSQYIPFAFPLIHSSNFRFCGQERRNHTFCKASGGSWEMVYDDNLDYIGAVFLKEYLSSKYQQIFNRELPDSLLQSSIIEVTPQKSLYFSNQLNKIMSLSRNINLNGLTKTAALLSSETLQVTLDTLIDPIASTSLEKSQSKRQVGVYKVVDYLHHNAHLLPDIATLCNVAGMSERSLQYGFLEQFGVTPIKYLRLIRLNGARKQLQNSEKKRFKVIDIALNWGFIELGRFSKEYKALFQEPPSKTLRL
ncbi:helix-turn-helix transcriptional regulator [Shewanella sp. 202IG2-18]|uniref:AraC family transcriptional regulator n=1 Tax=Parashewanella hymeniacidonis TaxID=2807618 RepID=UPI001960B8FF|nr:helix-turn-helix domain-containing protein [Parashewanella hymeniacidonis]MBM7074350.1 helix-turn-helix transcriptional regulator [Parashewanella hymeniacidonis]